MSREAMKQESVAWTPQVWRQFRPDGTLEFQKIRRTPNGEWEDYTAPQPRQWQGLTDEEVSEIIDREIGFNSCWGPEEAFARAIEQALKEKNT